MKYQVFVETEAKTEVEAAANESMAEVSLRTKIEIETDVIAELQT